MTSTASGVAAMIAASSMSVEGSQQLTACVMARGTPGVAAVGQLGRPSNTDRSRGRDETPRHLRRLVAYGGFRPNGTFISWPARNTVRLAEALCRDVLRLFVRPELFDEDRAAGMLA